MNATELYLQDGQPAGIYFCGKCKCVQRTQEAAEQCCKNYTCSECGKDTGSRGLLICYDCQRKREQKKERERFKKAEKITSWAGWVLDGDDFYESLDALFEAYEDLPGLPEYVWACKPIHFVHAEVSDITERMADQAYEDWEPDTLNGLDELKAAIEKFNEQNKDVCSYVPDYSKVVLVALIEREQE